MSTEGRTAGDLWGTCAHHAPDTEPGDCETRDCHLDPGIYEIVWGLWEAGVRTDSSCQGGGPPHSMMHRLVRVGHGDEAAGPSALATAQRLGMPAYALARIETADHLNFWWELWFRDEPWSRNDIRAEVERSSTQ